MKPLRTVIATFLAAALLASLPALAQAQLGREGAERKFTEMVLEHLGEKSRGGAACQPARSDRFRCVGRWRRNVQGPDGRLVKVIVKARGGAFENSEMRRSWAQLTKWKVVRGVKRGPFEGPFLMSTDYRRASASAG